MSTIFLLLEDNENASETTAYAFTSATKAKQFALGIENRLASETGQEQLTGLLWQLAGDGSVQTLEDETYTGSQYVLSEVRVDPA